MRRTLCVLLALLMLPALAACGRKTEPDPAAASAAESAPEEETDEEAVEETEAQP